MDLAAEFKLEPPRRKGRGSFLPESVVGIEVASPFECAITVIVTLKDTRGKPVKVPVVWSPLTGVVKRVSNTTWLSLGITEKLDKIRRIVLRAAKKEHKRLVLKYATPDMFEE